MRSRNQHLAVALKPRKRKLPSKDKANQTVALRPRWSRVTISHGKKPHGESDDTGRSASRFGGCSTVIDASNPNVIACDIVELLCESSDASNEKRTACPQISSSTELEEDEVDVCSTCKDCAECQLQQRDKAATAKIRKTRRGLTSGQDEELEHLDYYKGDIGGVEMASTSSTVVHSIEHGETPILVDLTSEESKQATWKQTILNRFGDTEESLEMSGENVITSRVSPNAINIVDLS